MNKKNYVLDTNVLICDSGCLDRFDDNDLFIPIEVIEELDHLKSRQDEVGLAARCVTRELERISSESDKTFKDGIALSGGGVVKIVGPVEDAWEHVPYNFSKADNKILTTFVGLSRSLSPMRTVLVTRDANLRLKCSSIGLPSEDYRHGRDEGKYTPVKAYVGPTGNPITVDVPQATIDQLHANKSLSAETSADVAFLAGFEHFRHNEMVVMKCGSSSAMARNVDGRLKSVHMQRIDGVTPRNKEQAFAIDALLDRSVSLVILSGPAGTGKTLISIAAALHMLDGFGDGCYRKLVLTRPVIPVGKDIGYLPGTVEEKMIPWLGAIRDNLSQVLSKSHGGDRGHRNQQRSKGQETSSTLISDPYLSLMMERGAIEIAAISHVRGRSIAKSFIIIDEAQNLSHHELKTVITRAAEGTKIVLLGDTDQIDNPHVDARSNGLSRAIDRFAGEQIVSHVHMPRGERSDLATLASKVLLWES